MPYFLVWLVWIGCLIGVTVPVQAVPVRSAHAEAELLSEVASIQPGQTFTVALRLKTDKDWHTYWRNPGDSGMATSLNWQLPDGLSPGPIEWPYPELISVPPLASYGYEDEVYLLTRIKAPTTLVPGQTLTLKAKAEWLECKEECLPGSGTLALDLPVKAGAPAASRFAPAFAEARSKLPVTIDEWQVRATATAQQLQLQATRPAWFTGEITEVFFFPEQDLLIEPAKPQTLKKSPDGFTLQLSRSAVSTTTPDRLRGVLVTASGWRGAGSERALQVDIPLGPAGTTSEAPLTLLAAVGFAFLGGLILNLMPCVLPVLSIKVLSFVQEAREGQPWRHGAVFTLGVLVSFWALAGGLLILRGAGEQLGWGFQLQSPPFLVVLVCLLFLFGLNLFGLFEVGGSLVGVGATAPSTGLSGSFMSGVLATVVATPCTAPFMGSALGFALTQPTWAAMLVFTSLGLGMSAPYLLLSLSPSLLRFVPKPGAWMVTFKQGMGFLLMATVVWLIWVLGLQTDVNSLAALNAALVVLAAGGWILGRWGDLMQPAPTRLIARLSAAAVIVGAVSFALVSLSEQTNASTGKAPTATLSDGIRWEPFSPARVEQLRAAGTPLFIDFTAAWCLSCQVNERVVFSSKTVRDEFERRKIVMMKADWTKRDATITQALAGFGRSGVPLYVLYGSETKRPPQILPEVLTPDIILKALQEMS